MTFGGGSKNFYNVLFENSNYNVINAGIGNTNTRMQVENFFKILKIFINMM